MGLKFQNVKGTRDFYPEEMTARNWLVQTWRSVSHRNGFEEYDGPTFEYLDLYTAKSGEAIISELFHFEDRAGRKLALRPEMTPTLARMVAARAGALPRPIRWFCVPNFFRGERPQRGRLREFLQWNVDIIGTDEQAGEAADAECIFVALDFLREVGLTPDHVQMKISSRVLLARILEALAIEPPQHQAVYAALDKRDKLPEPAFMEGLEKLGLSPPQRQQLYHLGDAKGPAGFAVVESILGTSAGPDHPLSRLKKTFSILQAMGVADYCVFDPGVVRGLAYYTGVVFEAYGKGTLQRAICGGGRYDQLLQAVGGPELSGVGFGMGDVIVLDVLQELGLLNHPQPPAGFFVADDGELDAAALLGIVAAVRQGLREPCHYSLKRVSLKKQLQQAVACHARFVIILGDRIALKDLRSGRQCEVGSAGSSGLADQREPFLSDLRRAQAVLSDQPASS